MKLNKIAVAVSAAVLGLSAAAQAEVSANIGAVSNYVWRGLTQTNDGAAIQGGIDYAHESGAYAGVWGSNVDWDGAGEEIDGYGGFSGETSGIGYDVGAIYYGYPSYTDDDFAEIYGSLTYGPVTAGINYTVYKALDDADTNDIYYHVSASQDLGEGWSVGATVGYYDFEGSDEGDYAHAQIDVTKSAGDFGDFTFSVSKLDDASYDDKWMPFVAWTKSF